MHLLSGAYVLCLNKIMSSSVLLLLLFDFFKVFSAVRFVEFCEVLTVVRF